MKTIKLPKVFQLSDENIRATILTLAKLVSTKNKDLFVNFSDLEETRKGDLIVLAAQVEKSRLSFGNKIYRVGKMPKAKKAKDILTSKTEMHHMNSPIENINLSDSEKEKLINPNLIDTIVKNLKKIGIKEYYHPFNVFLTELIGNAVEHGIQNKKINWWLIHEIDKKTNTVTYTFVDMGLGIINSHKNARLPFKYWFLAEERILLDALDGTLGSSTKQTNRGRGLPQLRGMIEKEYVGNAVLITNGVSLHYKNGRFVATKNPNFVGTYYSWTIDRNNYQKWKNIQ